MGQALVVGCGNAAGQQLLAAIRDGDGDLVQRMLDEDYKLLNNGFFHDRQTPLHVAAFHGQLQVLLMLLERGANPNALNSRGQTPLMLACKTGHWTGVQPLLEAGANILSFDYSLARTCLHYACRRGHAECVQRILDAARRGPVAHSWGFVRFVNVRDCRGTTALHLASRMGHLPVLRLLLDNGALVSATTTTTGNGPGHGSSPIHYAARGGSLDCVRELLAWGADRNQRDLTGYTPFGIAVKYNNAVCASILNPNGAEPLVWPSPWKFMSEGELQPEAKTLLEAALARANVERDLEIASQSSRAASSKSGSKRGRKRQTLASVLATPEQRLSKAASERMMKVEGEAEVDAATPNTAAERPLEDEDTSAGAVESIEEADVTEDEEGQIVCITKTKVHPVATTNFAGDHSTRRDGDVDGPGIQEVCCICFEQFCTIEVMECGHQMCATCTLTLCCHSKPNPSIPYSPPPSCPFCRRHIGHLILARPKHASAGAQATLTPVDSASSPDDTSDNLYNKSKLRKLKRSTSSKQVSRMADSRNLSLGHSLLTSRSTNSISSARLGIPRSIEVAAQEFF